jgi:serine protease Do
MLDSEENLPEETENKSEPEPSVKAETQAEADFSGSFEIPADQPQRAAERDTDRVNGEYHYKNGYTQRIYSDAHYVPEGENTVPPRYYTPPERPVKESAPKKKRGAGRALAAALVCAILGVCLGAGITLWQLNSRIERLTQSQSELQAQLAKVNETAQAAQAAAVAADGRAGEGRMSFNAIYDQACEEVVGITTEVTYQNFFGMRTSGAVTGSGFILSEDGYILTNYHVISYAAQGNYEVTVILHDGTRYPATVVGTEESNDLAVLKIEAAGLNPVTFADSGELRVGDEVHAVGNPLGELEFTMTNGHVSALDRVITTDESTEAINMFQIDAAVNSGNSGGPVYDALGRVVGVVTAKYSESGVEGIGFAIPVNDARKIADDLMTKGYVTGKAYMGITYDQRYNAMYAQYYGLPMGFFVRTVKPGSCAEKAGIVEGDIITKIGPYDITGYTELRQALKHYSAGDGATVTVSRSGRDMTFDIVFDEARPDDD